MAENGPRPKGKIARKGKAVKRDKIRNPVIRASQILATLITLQTLFPVPLLRANSGQGSAASAAAFKSKCALCHGPDGGGSAVGKTMNVPDLRCEAVQKRSDAELAQVISDGKGGMPSFKKSLSDVQIHSLVTYIRSLGRKK
jgi:mono/diheme cytochrome c family protein